MGTDRRSNHRRVIVLFSTKQESKVCLVSPVSGMDGSRVYPVAAFVYRVRRTAHRERECAVAIDRDVDGRRCGDSRMEGKRHRRGIICKMMLLLTPMVMPAKEREQRCARIEGLRRRRVTTIVLEKLQFLASNHQMTIFFASVSLLEGGGE